MYQVPEMPLTIGLWRAASDKNGPHDVTCPGAIRVPWGSLQENPFSYGSSARGPAVLSVPAGTDIRPGGDALTFDVAEVPAGSGRKYMVALVEENHLGFPGHHRVAIVFQLGLWGVPLPLTGPGPFP